MAGSIRGILFAKTSLTPYALTLREAMLRILPAATATGLVFRLQLSDCMSWMRRIGFRDMRVENLLGPDFMVIARKP